MGNNTQDKVDEVKEYNILVLGNGFDLAHGLKTKYTDFLDWVKLEYNLYKPDLEDKYIIESGIKDKSQIWENPLCYKKEVLLLDNVEMQKEIWTCISENIWIDYFINNPMYHKENWIDFEFEICRIIKMIEESDEKKIYFILTSEMNLDENIKNIKPFEINNILERDLDKLIVLLNNYLLYIESNIVDKLEIIPTISLLAKNIDFVLSFNYTHTFQKIYECRETKYHYIHGETKDYEISKNLVLGINEYLRDKDKKSNYIYFKKYFQRIYKKTGNDYKRWLAAPEYEVDMGINELLSRSTGNNFINKFNIHIFGHSLDVTDGDIIKELLLHENTHTTIYYHDEKAYRDQINNLVEILGQDVLIDCVSRFNSSINFVHSDKKNDESKMLNNEFYFKRDYYRIINNNDINNNALTNLKSNFEKVNFNYFINYKNIIIACDLLFGLGDKEMISKIIKSMSEESITQILKDIQYLYYNAKIDNSFYNYLLEEIN